MKNLLAIIITFTLISCEQSTKDNIQTAISCGNITSTTYNFNGDDYTISKNVSSLNNYSRQIKIEHSDRSLTLYSNNGFSCGNELHVVERDNITSTYKATISLDQDSFTLCYDIVVGSNYENVCDSYTSI